MKKLPNDGFSKVNEWIVKSIQLFCSSVEMSLAALLRSYFKLIDSQDPFVRLLRCDKPIPVFLLFLPTWWVVGMAAPSALHMLFFLPFFMLGAFIMRSAGCIINDIVDRDLDAKVLRTKNRPLANGDISLKKAVQVLLILMFFAALFLLMLPRFAIYIGIFALLPVTLYPFAKKFTDFPQVFLGFTFNIGVLIAWVAIKGVVGWSALLLYVGAAFWTIGYDTVYAYQDFEDDKKLGVRSTAQKFGEKGPRFIMICYQIATSCICVAGLHMHMNIFFYVILAVAFYGMYNKMQSFNIKDPYDCNKRFNANLEFAFIVFSAILIGRL